MKTEFQFLKNLKDKYQLSKIGDDCAVLPKDSKNDLLISADMLVEDIDFKLHWTKPQLIGHKALAVSLSDIAAMGGTPKYSMLSIGFPEKLWKTDFVEKLFEGYYRLGNKYKVEIIGGDISKTPHKLALDSVVLGEVKKGKAILRSGASPGDLIFVSGSLGGASAGLKLLEKGVLLKDSTPIWQKSLLSKQLSPFPQNGKILLNFATSLIDLSDGLSGDLFHLCEASHCGAKIFAEKIPVNKTINYLLSGKHKFNLSKNLDKLDFALHGGEDFELLFTISPSILEKNSTFFSNNFHQIGEITQTTGKIELIKDGQSFKLESKAYQHF